MAQAEADWLRRELERISAGPPIRFELVDEATVDALIDLCDPEIEFHETAHFPSAGVHRAHAGVRAYIAEFSGPFESFTMEIDEVVPGEGARVVAMVMNRVRGQGSGATAEMRSAWVFTIAGERIVRIDPFVDVEEALAAAGARRSA